MFNHNLEDRVKRLEEEIMYLHRDIANLINIIENYEPEYHTHLYFDYRTCKDDQTKSNDINDFF